MFSLLLVFLPIASSLVNNNSTPFLSDHESDSLLEILESGESQESVENQLIDLSNDTVLLPDGTRPTVSYSTPTTTALSITPPPGFNGTSFIAFEMPREELPQCPYCNISRCGETELCYIMRTGLRGKKSRERCTSEATLASLLVDHLMSNVTHDACQTAKSHHEKAYCWCSPRNGRVTVNDQLRSLRIWRYQTLHYYATGLDKRNGGYGVLDTASLSLLLLPLLPPLLL